MKRLFGSKPKPSKTPQVNPIPTPIPSDQLRPQPQRSQNTPADEWVLFNDDNLHDRSRSASFTSPPTSSLDHSVPLINGSMYQQPVANTTYSVSPHHSSHSLVAPSTYSSGFLKKKNSPPLHGVGAILRSLDPDPVSEPRGMIRSRSPSLESLPVSLNADRVRVEREHEAERVRERERQRDLERQREWERKDQERRERERQRELEQEKARLREKDKDVRREADRGRERDIDRERRKKEKKGLFGTSRDKDKDKEKEREGQAELTRMIGFLTATASEDWALVLHVCERASSSESMAKDACKALRREFKYAEPGAQLSAARLWAIMLRNCSEVFIAQASSKKFLDILEEVLLSGSTSPVVRERLMDVLAAAAYAYPGNGKEGYRALWRKVKPPNKPDEGVPFSVDEAMLNPSPAPPTPSVHSHGSIREQVIPLHEDMRRLFEECELGRGNAQLLNEALTFARPEELYGPVIGEWYRKCRNSQDFIMAQIPWATAQADRSREANRNHTDDGRPVPTSKEEELFAALLAANQDLLEVFRIYDDLQRLGIAEMEEKEVQERSRTEIKLDRTQIQFIGDNGSLHLDTPAGPTTTMSGSAGPSRSPSPARSQNIHPLPQLPQLEQRPGLNQLTLPRTTPHGPRPSRTPSPDSSLPSVLGHNASNSVGIDIKRLADMSFETGNNEKASRRSSINPETPLVPSAKAIGKRRAVPGTEDIEEQHPDDCADGRNSPFDADHSTDHDDDSTDGADNRWRRQPVKYVYDAAADRARELRRDLGIPAPLSNGSHR